MFKHQRLSKAMLKTNMNKTKVRHFIKPKIITCYKHVYSSCTL